MGKVKNLLPEEPVEGGQCPHDDCTGQLVAEKVENCSCHISAPCSAHIEAGLECNKCHEVYR